MNQIAHHISKFISCLTNAVSNGFDIYETIVCIVFIIALVFIIWIFAWMFIKISISLLDTIRVLINSLENVFNALFNGIKSLFNKLGEFGKQED